MPRILIHALLLFAVCDSPRAAEPAKRPLAVDDLFLMDAPTSVVVSPDGKHAASVRRWVDGPSRTERFSLWLIEGSPEQARALEPGEPDVRSVLFSPDGRWIVVRSTRPRPDGWEQTPAAPPESDAATDLWLVGVETGHAVPLAGPDKPYGRVFNDPFYGRVAFSPDGRRLAFVADDGGDPRTAEELEADVIIVRPDQGEGYTGYGPAQVWVAELDPQPGRQAAREIRRLTDDGVWYGDPQWSPDGSQLICHANKTDDVESVRYSINKNFDLWAIDVASGKQRQLTTGSGPEVSPRISPDGRLVACLTSPRKGPHADVFNLMLVPLAVNGDSPGRVLYDHHAASEAAPPHPVPAFPLPDDCWDGAAGLVYTSYRGVTSETVRVALPSGERTPLDEASADALARIEARRHLTPRGNRFLEQRLVATERVLRWTNDGLELEGVVTVPPTEVAKAPYPLAVYPHGGPHSRSAQGFNFTVQVLAAHGYLVFQPNFRGSSGYGRRFLDADRRDLGGGDMQDILSGVERLIAEGQVDRHRQFVYGISYGGFMTSWLVGHTQQFRAAAAQNAVTEMNVMWGLSDLQSWTEWELGGKPWEIVEAMHKHSPLAYADRVTTPTLVLHSREDRRCPLPMGRMFYQSLLTRGVPTQMVIYPHEGHGIRQPRHQADVLRRVLAWFAQHDVGK
jgi:dipeptidyl aminopeptidase/acylaminoacyl peptidase